MRLFCFMVLVLHITKVQLDRENSWNCGSVRDKVLLKRATLLSKYVFTGKVYDVKYLNSTRVYKVNIRRVLKGDLNDIGVPVQFGKPKSLRFSDATVMVESSRSLKCAPLRVRTYAIFLTERRHEEGALKLSLVIEPVILNLRSIEIIEAAVKVSIVVGGDIRIKGKVRKRFTTLRKHRAVQPPCRFNETIIEDEWSLMDAIRKSEYIFTGKVLHVKRLKPGENGDRSNLYRVYLRRVLKGSLIDLRMFVKEGSEDTLSGSTLAVERPRAQESCAPGPRPRLSAIFLCSGESTGAGRESLSRLQLLTDPVPLTLYHLDRINAAVKGSVTIRYN